MIVFFDTFCFFLIAFHDEQLSFQTLCLVLGLFILQPSFLLTGSPLSLGSPTLGYWQTFLVTWWLAWPSKVFATMMKIFEGSAFFWNSFLIFMFYFAMRMMEVMLSMIIVLILILIISSSRTSQK